MGALDIFWHALNFFVPALGVGMLSAAAAKWLWRRELAAVSWPRLARDACLAGAAVLVAGLVIAGRDGSMPTYLAMVLACALMLWWRGFRPGRR